MPTKSTKPLNSHHCFHGIVFASLFGVLAATAAAVEMAAAVIHHPFAPCAALLSLPRQHWKPARILVLPVDYSLHCCCWHYCYWLGVLAVVAAVDDTVPAELAACLLHLVEPAPDSPRFVPHCAAKKESRPERMPWQNLASLPNADDASPHCSGDAVRLRMAAVPVVPSTVRLLSTWKSTFVHEISLVPKFLWESVRRPFSIPVQKS